VGISDQPELRALFDAIDEENAARLESVAYAWDERCSGVAGKKMEERGGEMVAACQPAGLLLRDS